MPTCENSIALMLHKFDVVLCISDHADGPAPWETPARNVYVRGHDPFGALSRQLLGTNVKAMGRGDADMEDRATGRFRMFR